MPTYEYACRQCGEHLEVVQSFKDDPLTECPGCQGALRKVYSAAGLIFKGSGWHVKDYANSSKGSSSTKSDSSSDKGERSSGDSSGSKGGSQDTTKEAAKSGSTSTTSESSAKSA